MGILIGVEWAKCRSTGSDLWLMGPPGPSLLGQPTTPTGLACCFGVEIWITYDSFGKIFFAKYVYPKWSNLSGKIYRLAMKCYDNWIIWMGTHWKLSLKDCNNLPLKNLPVSQFHKKMRWAIMSLFTILSSISSLKETLKTSLLCSKAMISENVSRLMWLISQDVSNLSSVSLFFYLLFIFESYWDSLPVPLVKWYSAVWFLIYVLSRSHL